MEAQELSVFNGASPSITIYCGQSQMNASYSALLVQKDSRSYWLGRLSWVKIFPKFLLVLCHFAYARLVSLALRPIVTGLVSCGRLVALV